METIKEEKKADLEQMLAKLLNDLLRMGWKPFNRDKTFNINCYDKCKGLNYKWIHLDGGFMNEESRTLRELVSVDSGLWQFVCENGMVSLKLSARMKNPRIDWEDVDDYNNGHIVMNYKQKCEGYKAEYRLIESALTDEDKLEDFILQNVKVDEN